MTKKIEPVVKAITCDICGAVEPPGMTKGWGEVRYCKYEHDGHRSELVGVSLDLCFNCSLYLEPFIKQARTKAAKIKRGGHD